MNYKRTIFAFSLPLFAFALAGCSLPFVKKSGGEVTIKYWGLFEPASVVQPLIAQYQKENPKVKIIYEQQTIQQYRERVQTRITQGTGPDIFRFHNTWVPMMKNALNPAPQDVFSKDTFSKTFFAQAQRDLVADSDVLGIPLMYEGLGLYWNGDLFKNVGFGDAPKNWDELRTMAAALTVKDSTGRIKTAGVSLGRADNVDHFSDILAVMLLQNGVDLKKPISGDPQKDQLAADALDFYTLFAKPSVAERVWDETMENSTAAFAAGRVAMYFGPSWRAFEIKEANPSLNFKISPIPQLPGGKVTWASYWAEGVSQKSAHQKEAWKFLKFLAEKQSLVTQYTEASKLRLFGEPYSRVDLTQGLAGDPFVGAYVTEAPFAQSFHLASNTFDNGLNDRSINFLKDAVNAALKDQDPKRALGTFTQGIEQVREQFEIAKTSP